MTEKDVVLISTVYPYPTDTGKKLVLAGVLQHLVEQVGAERVHYLLVGADAVPGTPVVNVHPIPKPRAAEQISAVIWHSFVTRRRSIQEAILYSDEVKRTLHQVVDEIDPALVVLDTVRIGQFFETQKRPDSRYVLYMDDLFSLRYTRMLQVLRDRPDAPVRPLGNFARLIPAVLRPLVDLPFMTRFLLAHEQNLVSKSEQGCVDWFDQCLLINADEVERLRRATGRSNIAALPPKLRQPPARARNFSGEPVFVFLGALNLAHNEYSLMSFLKTEMAAVLRRLPNARLRVIGKGASAELASLAQQFGDRVNLEGYVEDLSTLFSEACAMIVPLAFGSGVKLKTLEALAHGLPVIATSYGVEGMPLGDATGCFVSDCQDDFPGLMEQLCDRKFNVQASQQATAFYAQNYSEQPIRVRYDRVFGENVE